MAREIPGPIYARRVIDPKTDDPRRDLFVANGMKDIPEVLLETGAVKRFGPHSLLLQTEVGEEACGFGRILRYYGEARTPSGWACKTERDAERRFEVIDGMVYPRPPIVRAQIVTSEPPEILQGANLVKRPSGGWRFREGHFHQEVGSREGFFVETGEKDGIPTGYVLHVGTPIFHHMVVCDEHGKEICTLAEWYRKHKALVPVDEDAA